jgi:hypothetical protein
LNWSDRRLLRKLARSRGLSHPARLFVEPGHFEPSSLAPPLRPQAGHLDQLRHRLFQ